MSPDPKTEIIPPRKKGAQPGNSNAMRHGFYARNLGNFPLNNYSEGEMRNLLGEVAMIKDYMYYLYNINLESSDSAVLSDTLRALSMAGMALARMLQVHKRIRVGGEVKDASLDDILSSLSSATTRANKY